MIFEATSDGWLELGRGRRVRCALGRGGVAPAKDKREGDGKTPLGEWPLRRVLYRADRLTLPATTLPAAPIEPQDAWCDVPSDPKYNLLVRLPYPSLEERLWREDPLYDLIVVVGFNDSPVVPGRGSAIFLHVARPGFTATAGCVALKREDLAEAVAQFSPHDHLSVTG